MSFVLTYDEATNAAVLLPQQVVAVGSHTLVIRDSGRDDAAGLPLDGENGDAGLPSKDGVADIDGLLSFTVAGPRPPRPRLVR